MHLQCLPAGHDLVCTLNVVNSGKANVTALTFPGQPGCNLPDLMPGGEANCSISKVVSQTDYNSWDTAANDADKMFSISAIVQAKWTPAHTPYSTNVTSPEAVKKVALPLNPGLALLSWSRVDHLTGALKQGNNPCSLG